MRNSKTTKTSQEIINSYKIKFALICVFCAAVLAGLVFIATVNTLMGAVCIVIALLNARKPFELLKQHELESVLYEELDPDRFADIVEQGGFEKSKKYAVLVAMSRGDHEKVLSIANELLEKEMNPLERCNALYRKAYVYFERQDLVSLRGVLKEFEGLKASAGKYAGAFARFTVFEKFDAYLDEDYEYVRDVCNVDLGELDPKQQNHKLTRINVSFYRACALFKLGELDAARDAFEDLIAFAPKMYKAKLAREWLDKIG